MSMFDVGDTVLLATAPVDEANNPVAVDNLTVTITLPDGTSTSEFTPDPAGTGRYTRSYITSQAGRHLARWVGDGYADAAVFNVWPADPRFLFSIEAAWQQLGTTPPPSSRRTEQMRLHMAAVTPVIEDIVGPLIGAGSVTVNGGVSAVLIPPGATVTSVTENGNTLVDGTFTVDKAAGIVYAGGGYACRHFARGRQNVTVAYRVDNQIPPNVLLAALEEFRFLWRNSQAASHGRDVGGSGGGSEDVEFTPSGFAVPRYVSQLCASHRRGPVIA